MESIARRSLSRNNGLTSLSKPGVSVAELIDVLLACSSVAAEDRKEEQEDVENVEEDRRGEQGCRTDVSLVAQPVEVEQRQPGEDREPCDRIDERSAWD